MIKIATLLVLLASLSILTQAEDVENEKLNVGQLINRLALSEYSKWVVNDNPNWFFQKTDDKKWVFMQDGAVTNRLDEVSSDGPNVLMRDNLSGAHFEITGNALYRVPNINHPNRILLLEGQWEGEQKSENLKWKFTEYEDTYLEKVSDSEWILTQQGLETDRLVEISLINDSRLGLVVILFDNVNEYYRLTNDMLFSGTAVNNIRNPRNIGHWVNPEVIMPSTTTTTTPRPIRTTTTRPMRTTTTTRPIRTTTTTRPIRTTTTTTAITTTQSIATTHVPPSNRLKWVFDVPKGWFFEKRNNGWILNQDGQIFRMVEVRIERNLKGPVVVLKDPTGYYYRLTEGQLLEGPFENLQLRYVAPGRWENL